MPTLLPSPSSIHKYASCSKECFILALIYIDRLIQRNNFLLTDLNVHRVVITAVLLAAKFFDDAYYNNAYYAKVGGVAISEMNSLEIEFLFKVDFSLRVLPEVYEKYRAELVSHASDMGIDRIATCSDEELFSAVSAPLTAPLQQQMQAQEFAAAIRVQQAHLQQAVAAATMSAAQYHQPARPVAVTRSPFDPSEVAPLLQTYSQGELDQVMCPNPIAAAPSYYPIQGLQQSASTEMQVPFPALAHQVSVQQQPQPQPAQNPAELNLAPQDMFSIQSLQQGVAAALQAQSVYAQPEFDSAWLPMDGSTAPAPQVAAANTAQQAPGYPQQTNYNFNYGLQQQQSYPEITPSPPPQPPINIYGAPSMGEGMGLGCSAQHHADLAYFNQSAATTLHASHHQHHYPTPSRPIAIPNAQTQDPHLAIGNPLNQPIGSWSRMVTAGSSSS